MIEQGLRFREAESLALLRPAGTFKTNQNDGRTSEDRFFLNVAYGMSDCWYWVGSRHKQGYGILSRGRRAHRVSWEMHFGPIPHGLFVLHTCDVTCCVNPDHLFLGTQTDNMQDMVNKGRGVAPMLTGERNPMSKLTADIVEEMKQVRAATGASYAKIAKQFNATTMTAYRAIVGQSWASN